MDSIQSMAESFSRWESDPLFCAAEVVQDSADRMESVYRSLLHEQNLAQEDHSHTRFLTSVQYHRRDLATALETTRWQLEDFEREVNIAALSDESKTREIAILKHKQFIRAIRELIVQVQRSVQDSSKEDHDRNPQWMNLNEQDKDMLTSFLSGGNFEGNSSNYVTGGRITRRFVDSNTDEDDISELKPEDVEVLPMNDAKDVDSVYGSSRNLMSWKRGSGVFNKRATNGLAFFQGLSGKELEKQGVYDLEFGGLGTKSYSSQNTIKGSAWGFLRNFWLGNGSRGSFTKMRKDGEITGLMQNTRQRITYSTGTSPPDQQGKILKCLMSAMHLFRCMELDQRRYQTSLYLIPCNCLPAKLTFTIIVLVSIICIWQISSNHLKWLNFIVNL